MTNNNKSYPPAYYRYKAYHKTISLSFDINEYDLIMKFFSNTNEIKKTLLDISQNIEVSPDLSNKLKILQEKYDRLLKTNQILIEKNKN